MTTIGYDDAHRRRTSLTLPNNIGATHAYDTLGRRTAATVGTPAKAYLYDGSDVVQEKQGGAPSANLLTGAGIDERYTRATTAADATGGTPATSTYLTDALGSTVALATGAGTVATNYGYDSYGVPGVTGAANDNPYQFTGRENDGTGLLYNRARYYNPTWGRFISEDPIGLRGGINRYAYAGGDPVSFRDPSGHFGLAGAIGGGIIGGIAGGITASQNGASLGGILRGVAVGGFVGALVGVIDPFLSEEAGAVATLGIYTGTDAAAGFLGSLAAGGNLMQATDSAIGGALGGLLAGESLIAASAGVAALSGAEGVLAASAGLISWGITEIIDKLRSPPTTSSGQSP